MTIWLQGSGSGAITDGTLKIRPDRGGAIVQPTRPDAKQGAVHFILPAPPRENPTIRAIDVDFEADSAYVDAVAIRFANMEAFREKFPRPKTSSFRVPVPKGEAEYNGRGVVVTVYVKFQELRAAIDFDEVRIAVE
ncbi:hypothetical protein AbraIFM66951_004768 [Aspergillus brasiliensis]|uniref:Uncharacterized protein n=2 Tax=Aspergillus brasiliensis TaxID=319629 RepID=A0A1L9U9Q3_ASPBC|nr:hypothetical protein ASPBRDRAFT_46613 [Aspergillus brasiliensis CBS 101740]GKZ17466.1 hypothetical protein AbraCBS73388_008391 [Aspergillus brasiliensis]GKZ39075.1 hypothetical protein AbraIFM66950_011833 [Aspergillus brasiliensis]GKZ43522.1 hypothetical protein AbraIFM66951_004768 [Aspergillus brasiliensis]